MAQSQNQGWPVWVGSAKVKCALLINTLLVQVAQSLFFSSSPLRSSIPDYEASSFPLIQTQPTESATTSAWQEIASPSGDCLESPEQRIPSFQIRAPQNTELSSPWNLAGGGHHLLARRQQEQTQREQVNLKGFGGCSLAGRGLA